jgi:hypothetical protein
MAATHAVRKGMSRILDGIMKYRQTLRPTLLEEFKKVALGPSVRIFNIIEKIAKIFLYSLKVFF